MSQQKWLNCPKMNHDEWLLWRRNGIGSSDAPVIMNGTHFGKNWLDKWEEKVFGKTEQDNIFMKHGRDNEEEARRLFENGMGKSVFPSNVENSEHSWLRASLDGIDVNGDVLVEIKCPTNGVDQLLARNGKIPEKYVAQCQHQLAVTGLPGMYYFSFQNGEGVIVEVARDGKYIEELLSKEQEFWDMVMKKEPPEISMCMEGNPEWERLSAEMFQVRDNRKEIEKREEEIMITLKLLSDGRSARGHGLELQKQICKGAVDYSKIPQLEGVDLEIYRKKSFEKWRVNAIK